MKRNPPTVLDTLVFLDGGGIAWMLRLAPVTFSPFSLC
jgi:hypothetical protein